MRNINTRPRAARSLILLGLVGSAFAPAAAFAQTTTPTTVAAPDFSAVTSYIYSAVPVGVAALGVAIIAALAFAIILKLGKKIVSAT